MFQQIFVFELKLWFKKPSTYIFFLVFFFISMLITAATAGLLGGGTADSNAIINSASAIADILNGISNDLIGAIIIITIVAPAVYKDFQYTTHPLLFTKPISKFGYLGGRFFASFLVALLVLSGSVFGHIITCMLPGIAADKLGAFSISNYLQPFLLFVIPNTLLVGVLFFSFVTFSRNMIAGYVSCVALILLKSVAATIFNDIENQKLGALLEPFGESALNSITKYWSPSEQNTLAIPFRDELLYNRLIWFSVGIAVFMLTYFQFQFSQFNTTSNWFKKKEKEYNPIPYNSNLHTLSEIVKAKQNFTLGFGYYQMWFLAKFEFTKVVKSIFFLIIVGISVISFAAVSSQLGLIYGTSTFPVTYQILQFGGAIFQFFMLVLIVFYSGLLIWRERDAKVDELVGVSPTLPWVSFASKLIALILIQLVLLFVLLLTGVGIQMYNGYYHFEIIQYIKELFGFKLISLTIVCVFALAMQILINQKFVGYFITILILILLPIAFNLLEWNNQLIQFNSGGPRLPYSDMNGYGHIIYSYTIFKSYWFSFSLFLIALSNLFYVRGKDRGIKYRLRISKARFSKASALAIALSLLAFIALGSFIYYNTSVLNDNRSTKEQEKQLAEFEKKYKRYSKTQQPRIVSVNWNVDIYPEKLGAAMNGYYILKNKSTTNIDSIVMNVYQELTIKTIQFDKPSKRVVNDTDNGFYIYKLAEPIKPGDSLRITMDIAYFPKGFKNADAGSSIVYNGTFFNSTFLPSIGYNDQLELSEDSKRKKYGLHKKERMPSINDNKALMNTYISNDADWIDFECVLSTTANQTAIAPGYLIKTWSKDNRNYFQYKMDSKILNFYSFLSAHYEIKKDTWHNVAIEIYYQKGHEYNLDRMIGAIKKSLDYYTVAFSPYQHKQVRIIEFPRYATYAQSFPNTIPFSEGIGFIAKVDNNDPESIDYPFYVTAHEVAHQWWAHQVIGGNVQGSTLLAETMAQYSALMVMEKQFGKQAMKKFLKYEMSQYLQGRATEGKKELPLIYVENQQYIHYNKGSVVMYALKDYIGEDTLNAALARFIKHYAFKEPPYANSIDFVNYLKQATPDSLKYIINDMFETITLYENKTTNCTFTKTKAGKYLVKIDVECKKMRADSIGKLKDVAINDWIDIGVFGSQETNGKKTETELYLKKHKIDKTKMHFEFIVNQLPVSAGIDPYHKLIDRTPENNVLKMNASAKPDSGEPATEVNITIKSEN